MSRVEHYITAISMEGDRIVGGCRCGGAFMCNTVNWLAEIIAGWASGKVVKMWSGEGWLVITPDNLHGMTDEKEWVTLREAIARYDARTTKDEPCSHQHCDWVKDEERYDCER